MEVIDSNINLEYFKSKIKNSSKAIKTLLLDQTVVSGLGNIYADEVLFASKINPLRKANELNDEELQSILDNSKIIVLNAIKNGGTTIRSYTSSLGVEGRYQSNLKVYKKEGLPCLVCGNKIQKMKINGRSAHYCPVCQK